jgi:hypothetical protein
LLHSRIVVTTLIQKVTIFAIDSILLQGINPNLLCKINGQNVEIALVKNFQPLLKALLAISEYLPDFSKVEELTKKQ